MQKFPVFYSNGSGLSAFFVTENFPAVSAIFYDSPFATGGKGDKLLSPSGLIDNIMQIIPIYRRFLRVLRFQTERGNSAMFGKGVTA